MEELFRSDLVRLTFEEPDALAKAEARWQRDSEFVRLAGGGIRLFSENRIRERFVERRVDQDFQPERYPFSVRTLADDRLIGFVSLFVDLIQGDAWVGIGIGERDLWNKGYGTDIMRLILRYAFLELSLQRVSLALHDFNTRALRSYEKAGFRLEGRTRQDVMREGRHTDTLWMGILRAEWLALQSGDKK